MIQHRDHYLTNEQMVEGLRVAFDARVTQEFCITDEEAQDLLNSHPAEIILEAFATLGAELRRQAKRGVRYQQDEIVLDLLPHSLERASASGKFNTDHREHRFEYAGA